tara:strand:- start:9383 stop:9856 length:474 start_codon:yes stop_codon:yes gene_type:complete
MTPIAFINTLQSFSFEFQKRHYKRSKNNSLCHTYHIYICVKKLFPRLDIQMAPSIIISEASKEIFPKSLVIWINGETLYDVNYETWSLYNKHYYECLSEIPKEIREKMANNVDYKKLFYECSDVANKINNGKKIIETPYFLELSTFCHNSWELLQNS